MQHKRSRPNVDVNRIAEYIDATDDHLEDLHRSVRPRTFAELSKHVWSHVWCLRLRLAVLEKRTSENGDKR
jgi:hypothetical protein